MRRVRGRLALGIVLSAVVSACSPAPTGPLDPTTLVAGETDVPVETDPPRQPEPTPGGDPGSTPAPSASSGPATGSQIVPGSVRRSSLEIGATYDVNASITVASGKLEMATLLRITNRSGDGIDRLELNTIAASLGSIKVTAATVDDVKVKVRVHDQTLIVPLGGVLPDGASATVWIVHRASLRTGLSGSDWMFTRAGGTVSLHRWIPWISADVPSRRPKHGDPFVTTTSPQVDVEILADQRLTLVAPTAEVVQVQVGTGRHWSFTVRDVRDVSVILAPRLDISTGEAAGIPVRLYTPPGSRNRELLMSGAIEAVEGVSALLGVDYPLPSLTVVETQGGEGLESPGLVWIPRTETTSNRTYLVYHEIAHQWFYGLVGNNQQREPFADEAVADVISRTLLGMHRRSRCAQGTLDRSITGYTNLCYYETIDVQGGLFLDDLRRRMGSSRFWKALAGYLETNRLGVGSTRQLLEAIRAESPVDLLPLLRARFPTLY